jgi:hypothetical protein
MNSTATFERLRLYYASHPRGTAAAFFAAGFVCDMLTLGRIDSWLTIGQQALYLGVAATLLLQMLVGNEAFARYREPLVHFLLGALLNVYALFFFKSSSLLVSFGFLAFIMALLFANESRRFKSLGLPFKFVLLSLCLLSFAAVLVPVLVGSIGTAVFLLSMLDSPTPAAAFSAGAARDAGAAGRRAGRFSRLLPAARDPAGAAVHPLHRGLPRRRAHGAGLPAHAPAAGLALLAQRRPVVRGAAG